MIKQYAYDEFYGIIHDYQQRKLLNINWLDNNLYICNYTHQCQFDKHWDDITTMCRGMILSHQGRRVVSWPLPKFFNYGELTTELPSVPFDVYEKYDGSLGISYYYNGNWRIATRGSFTSDQAQWATHWLDHHKHDWMIPGYTYLFEIIYPNNRIVVNYQWQGLVLLAVYDADGQEVDLDRFYYVGNIEGFRVSKKYGYSSISDLLDIAQQLDSNSEGFVVRFNNGFRIKIKGQEYVRIHRIVSNVTPLGIWDILQSGQDDTQLIVDLPEEIRGHYLNIKSQITAQYDNTYLDARHIINILQQKRYWSSAKLVVEGIGKYYKPQHEWGRDPIPHIILSEFRNNNRTSEIIWKHIRPTNNDIDTHTIE